MIEKTVLDYLAGELAVPVYMEIPAEATKPYVVIEKTGGTIRDFIKSTAITIQSYADTMYEASLLNENVKIAMASITSVASITDVDLNADTNYTDTEKKGYRYQSVFYVTHY